MDISTLKQVLFLHEKFWETKRLEMLRYKSAYATEFWSEGGIDLRRSTNQLQIQVSEGYSYIETYMGSLFAKNPAIVLKSGIENKGSTQKSQFIANSFLKRSRNEIESGSRLALIYTHSFIKLVPNDNENILQKIIPVAVAPWDVILDYDANRWDLQKYVGHIYHLTKADADKRFGKKDWTTMTKLSTDYFHKNGGNNHDEPTSAFEYIKCIELYDIENDKLLFYSPNWRQDKFLESEGAIPFRTYDNQPVVPIAPYYYNRMPDAPLEGYSAMKRVYDQLFEMNIIRSFQANAVRKASRQYLVKKGAIDSTQMAQITAGIDGIFVEIEEESISGIIQPIPQNPSPPELEAYYQRVVQDKDKGSIMAPFTRGEATKVTATEAAALAAYTSSEIGRLARERDAVIENLVRLYLNVLGLYISDTGNQLIFIDNKLTAVSTKDILGDFDIFASDSSSTPMSESIIKGQLLANIPTLTALGVPKELMLDEVVRTLNLPESFKTAAIAEYMSKAAGAAVPALQKIPQSLTTSTQAVANPSVKNIADLLPGGLAS